MNDDSKSAAGKDEFGSRGKSRSVWSRIAWSVLAVGFAFIGAMQLAQGRASGEYGFPVERRSDPVLFWLFIATHFAIAAWILIVVLKGDSTRNENGG